METNVKTKTSNEALRELLKEAGLLKDQPAKSEGSTLKNRFLAQQASVNQRRANTRVLKLRSSD